MSWRDEDDSVNDRYMATPRSGRVPKGRPAGPHVGPLRITPTRVILAVALFGSAAFVLYALTVRESTQIPMLVAGAAVLGLVFAALAVAGVIATYRAAKAGEGARSFVMAVLGGIAAVIAFGCFASATILALAYG